MTSRILYISHSKPAGAFEKKPSFWFVADGAAKTQVRYQRICIIRRIFNHPHPSVADLHARAQRDILMGVRRQRTWCASGDKRPGRLDTAQRVLCVHALSMRHPRIAVVPDRQYVMLSGL